MRLRARAKCGVYEVFVHVVRVFLGKDFINSLCGQAELGRGLHT